MRSTHAIVPALLALSSAAYSGGPQEGPLAHRAYLKASNPDGSDAFGDAVAISGNTVAVGAWSEDSFSSGINGDQYDDGQSTSGAVYVFVRENGVWSQQAYIKADPSGQGDFFGISLDLEGDTLVVGAYGEGTQHGAAYVFERDGDTWSQEALLRASNAEPFDLFGASVAISGDTIVVGATDEGSDATGVNGDEDNNHAFDSGAAYVFVRDGDGWTQQAYLKASNTGSTDSFGDSVAISGHTIVVGARHEDSRSTEIDVGQQNNGSPSAGAAYVFVRNGTTWSQQAYLKAPNTDDLDQFGVSVAVSGDTVLVGAFGESSGSTEINGNMADNNATNTGAAYVFVRSGTTWGLEAYLKAANAQAGDNFGIGVALEGDRAVVTAPAENGGGTGVNPDPHDNSQASSGAGYVFAREGSTWTQRAYIKASNTESGDSFGQVADLSGSAIVVGTGAEDSSASGVGGDESDNSMNFAGAAYVYDGTCESELAAAELPVGGTPANPSAFLPGAAYGPVLGATWNPSVDHTSFVPTSVADFLLISAVATEVDLGPVGTLLCAPPYLAILVDLQPSSPFQIPIPPDCELMGVTLRAQAGSSPDGAAFSLANALDITFGSY